jgi:signal transduction histidine kinase/CheY-like chemotaxis protein
MSATRPPAAPPCVPGAGRAAESALFRQFTRWVFWLCLIFGAVMLAAGMHLADPRLELMAAILVGHATVTCTLVARARMQSLERAGLIMSMATLISILAFSFVAPTFGPALVVATLVPAALALQHGRRQRAQLWLIALCGLSAIFIGVLAEIQIPQAETTWLDRAFRLSGTACSIGIMLLLLWQSARRSWDQKDAAEGAQQEALIAEARLRERETQLEGSIEERARLASQLRDAQQLAALGRLIGGVAQDFNNHLTSLIGYTELLLWELTDQNDKRQDLLEIRRAAERATQLTQQLLAFSHLTPANPVVLNVGDVIMNSVRVLRRVLGPDVRLVTTLARDTALIRADATLLGYVLLNLGAQAREAMPCGGTLAIETVLLDVDASATTHSDLRDWPASQPSSDLLSGFVRIAVIAARRADLPDALANSQMATGNANADPVSPPSLGLTAIDDVVRESGGSVISTVDAAGNRSTTIYLPRVHDVEQSIVVESVAPRGMETVLVVESENVVRDYVRTLLDRHGYHTLVAEGPRDASTFTESPRPSIDLAIVNLVSQDESTSRFVRTLTVMHPGLRVLYMTHHLASSRSELRRMPRSGFTIEKPFKPNEFLLAVRQALDSMPASSQEFYPLA